MRFQCRRLLRSMGLMDKLTDLQHQYHDAVMSSVHAHLDHDNCLRVNPRAREIGVGSQRSLIPLSGRTA